MLGSQLGINDVERLLAPLEPVFDERKQHTVFFVGVMKKGADVTLCVKHRAREPNGLAGLARRSSTRLHTIISGIHRVLLRQAAHRRSALDAGKLLRFIQRDFTLIARMEAEDFGGRKFGLLVPASSGHARGIKSFRSNCEVCTLRFVAKTQQAPRSAML